MRSLSVEAGSLESAQSIYSALAEFRPELAGGGKGGFRVMVELGSFDGEVITILDVLERYVTQQHAGPTRVELDGRAYTLRGDE